MSRQDLLDRIKELEAEAAAMREALEELTNAPAIFDDERLDYVEVQVLKASLNDAQKAIQSNAGRRMLERARKMRDILQWILPGAMAASCLYRDDPKADPTFHCCDWSEAVEKIREVLSTEEESK